MKKYIFALFSLLFAISSFAQLNGNGYYRVKNVASERYITVIDNRGSINVGTTSADLGAVRLYKGFDNVVSNPASILYVEETASGYKFYAQGTDTYQIIGYYLKLRKLADNKYMAYQSASGLTMYLGDPEKSNVVDGPLGTNAKGDYNKWYILPVDDTSDNYFGFTPEVKCGGNYYASFYASFPFGKVSKDLKIKEIAVAGGVSANTGLRNAFHDHAKRYGWNIYIPKFSFTTDNAAMIAITGYYKYLDKDFCSIDKPAYSRVTI